MTVNDTPDTAELRGLLRRWIENVDAATLQAWFDYVARQFIRSKIEEGMSRK